MLPTIADTVALIRAGWDPWRSLNAFLHAWYDDEREHRAHLIADPIVFPPDMPDPLLCWSLLCAGAVEYLCHEAAMPLPEWLEAVPLTLPAPWYPEEEGEPQPTLRQKVQEVTPWELQKRNIWCRAKLFQTKYHWAGVLR